ncbi:MAG TPA: metallophosphoesterase family protein [Candidatus Spyradocola merdavium]|nr:metallophosphoesterase family protein [Candidatus Spyradocola merdavium]
MKLVILSDTHGLLRPAVQARLEGADAILHAGDVNTPAVVEALRGFAPLYIVRGNNDKDWAASLPLDLRFSLGGLAFHMVHDKRDLPADLAGVDVVVYGHSHRYAQEVRGGVLYLNPGSCGPRRFHQEITLAEMAIEDGACRVEKIVLPHEP